MLTQTPVGKSGDQLHITGDCQDVEIVECSIHRQDHRQVQHGLGGDVPHLPLFAGQLGVVGLEKRTKCHVNAVSDDTSLQLSRKAPFKMGSAALRKSMESHL